MKANLKQIPSIIFILAVIGSVSFLMVACGSSTPPPGVQNTALYSFSKINCYARYVSSKRELQAEVTFRTDSTIAIEGDVALNNESMIFKKLPKVGLQYRLLKNGVSFENKYTFSYTEKNGSQSKLTIEMSDFDSLIVASDGLSKKTGGLLKWQGEPLDKEDGLVLVFSDSKGKTFSINHSGISKGNMFEILPEYAQRLEKGAATLQVTRKRTVLLRENETTKLLTLEYYLRPIKFEVSI